MAIQPPAEVDPEVLEALIGLEAGQPSDHAGPSHAREDAVSSLAGRVEGGQPGLPAECVFMQVRNHMVGLIYQMIITCSTSTVNAVILTSSCYNEAVICTVTSCFS